MTDQAPKSADRRRSSPRTEYRIFFAIIFLLALPVGIFTWFRDLLRGDVEAVHHGVVGRALTQANATTPMIFSAQ